jgi:hypothetical protein
MAATVDVLQWTVLTQPTAGTSNFQLDSANPPMHFSMLLSNS